MNLSQKVILIVDDEPLIREIIITELSELGCKFLEAENGKVALDLVRRSPIDLIISDVRMPSLSGIQFLDLLKETQPAKKGDIGIFMMSGFTDASIEEIKSKGAQNLFAKPLDLPKLRDAVHEYFVHQG